MTRYVPIDLHRHRSVVMQMTAEGEVLGWSRLANDPEALVAEVLKNVGAENVEVAIEDQLDCQVLGDLLVEHVARSVDLDW